MKKILAIALSVLAFAAVASAQPRAIGIRAGGDAELSYQHSIGSTFVEADLGMALGNYAGIQLTAIYDFVFASFDNFNCYVGPGAQVNMWTGKTEEGDTAGKFGVGVGGQLGIEYQFGTIPFGISLDWRPMWNFIGKYGAWSSAALGFRYRF